MSVFDRNHQSGLTLLEVMITLGILVTMMFAVSQMLRSSFDMKFALSESARVTNRVNVALNKITVDVSHAFIQQKLEETNSSTRSTKTIFKVERQGESDKLGLTTMSHRPLRENAKEYELTYVVYEVRKSEKTPTRSDLYRGEFPRVPLDFKEEPKMEIIAKNIKSLKIEGWQGDDWYRDRWDSTRSDTRYRLPQQVRITLSAWLDDDEGAEVKEDDGNPENYLTYQTVTHLPFALPFEEMKERTKSLRF